MTEPRYCSNCRAPLAQNATACDACGVFAGEVFDGRKPRAKKPSSGILFFILVVAILATAAWWLMNERQKPAPAAPPPPLPSVRVVADRPGGSRRASGAAISEAEAIRILRRHLVSTTGTKDECLAVISLGPRDGGYVLSVVDGCKDIRLGRWRVDGTTSAVTRAR